MKRLVVLIMMIVGMMTFLIAKENLLISVLGIEIFEKENEIRAEFGLEPFVYNEALAQAAQEKAGDMAELGYFAHAGLDGSPFWYWIVKNGYDFLYSGENLAVKFKTSEGVVQAWMLSPGHRDNILNQGFIETGIGIAQGEYKGVVTEFVVQFFGKKNLW